MILCLSTSQPQSGVSIVSEDQIVSQLQWSRSGQVTDGEMLTPHIEKVLNFACLQASDLTGLVIDIGPGSFTGIRTAVASAKALGMALNIPLVAVSSLRIMAQLFENDSYEGKKILTARGALQGQVFCAQYYMQNAEMRCEIEPECTDINHFSELCQLADVLAGELADLTLNESSSSEKWVSVKDLPQQLSLWTIKHYKKVQKMDWTKVFPLYLKRSSAEEKLKYVGTFEQRLKS